MSRVCSGAIAAPPARSTPWSRSSASRPRRCCGWPGSSAVRTPPDPTWRRRPLACWPPPWGYPGCTPTISSSSKPAWRCTTRSIAGVVTPSTRRTTGHPASRRREMTDIVAERTRGLAARSAFPSFGEAVRVWARIAALSFGGPAGQIAVMHRILVDEKRWIGEHRFLHALNYCMLLPGPEAQQLAVYIGWLLHKTRGGLVAGTLFVLPGFLAIMALSLIYAVLGKVGIVVGLFFGLKAAVLAVVL